MVWAAPEAEPALGGRVAGGCQARPDVLGVGLGFVVGRVDFLGVLEQLLQLDVAAEDADNLVLCVGHGAGDGGDQLQAGGEDARLSRRGKEA